MTVLPAMITWLRSILLLVPFTIHLILADVLLSLLLPFSWVVPNVSYELCSRLAGSVWGHIQLVFTKANHAMISRSATSSQIPRGESAIVVANHVSWTDFYMIQEIAHDAGMLDRCRWFAKSQLKWVPLLGWGLWAMGMPMVTRDWTHDEAEMKRVFGGIQKRRWPIWLVAFSEATRFTPAKYADTVKCKDCNSKLLHTAQRLHGWCAIHTLLPITLLNVAYIIPHPAHGILQAGQHNPMFMAADQVLNIGCHENRKPIPQHTLVPRHRGFVTTVQQLRQAPHVRAVYDMTIAYAGMSRGKWVFMKAPSMWQSLSTRQLDTEFRFFVHVDRHPLEDLPNSPNELRAWLEDKWVQKGERLEKLRLELEKGFWNGRPLK